jgi:hypothetical protein
MDCLGEIGYDPHSPSGAEVVRGLRTASDLGDNAIQRIRTYFHAADPGEYVFHLSASSPARLFLAEASRGERVGPFDEVASSGVGSDGGGSAEEAILRTVESEPLGLVSGRYLLVLVQTLGSGEDVCRVEWESGGDELKAAAGEAVSLR